MPIRIMQILSALSISLSAVGNIFVLLLSNNHIVNEKLIEIIVLFKSYPYDQSTFSIRHVLFMVKPYYLVFCSRMLIPSSKIEFFMFYELLK